MEAARAGNLRLENVSFAYPLRPNSGGVVLCYALPSRSIGKCTYLSTPVSVSPSPAAFACSYATPGARHFAGGLQYAPFALDDPTACTNGLASLQYSGIEHGAGLRHVHICDGALLHKFCISSQNSCVVLTRCAVLKGLNLELKRGTSTAVVGRSGAGKSTIASLLSRFYEPDEGAGRTKVSCASSGTGRCLSNAPCRRQPCIASRLSRQADKGGASENSAARLNAVK